MRREKTTSQSRAARHPRRDAPTETASPSSTLEQAPNPLWDVCLFGMQRRRHDLLVSLVLIAVVVLSRTAAFPGSIWDQDEAYFATAVISFDPAANQPHPPWFPLFIGMAKLVHSLGAEPGKSLQLVSAALGCWIIFPLVSLWSVILGRKLGIAAAALFLFAPGPWLLAGRAYSGTAATSFLVAGLALWLVRSDGRWSSAAGALFSGLGVLTRPHFLPVVLAAMIVGIGRQPGKRRVAAVGVLTATLAAGGIALAIASDGIDTLGTALSAHVNYHFGALPDASRDFAHSGFFRCLLSPMVGWSWSTLTVIGVWSTVRDRSTRHAAGAIAVALAAVLAVVFALSDPDHARYFVPVLALSSGFVVASIARIHRHLPYLAVSASVAVSVGVITPHLADYRSATAPPVAALTDAARIEENGAAVLVIDHTLVSFVKMLEASQPAFPPVIYDNQIESGRIPPPPPRVTVAVFASNNDRLIEMEHRRRIYSCAIPVIRQLERARFLDVVVSDQPVLEGWVDDGKPYILVDGS